MDGKSGEDRMNWEGHSDVYAYTVTGEDGDSQLKIQRSVGYNDNHKWEGNIEFDGVEVTVGWDSDEKKLMEKVERAYHWAMKTYGLDYLNKGEWEHIKYKEEDE
jgi:hypothetical protein